MSGDLVMFVGVLQHVNRKVIQVPSSKSILYIDPSKTHNRGTQKVLEVYFFITAFS